jgi:hypothetical protein
MDIAVTGTKKPQSIHYSQFTIHYSLPLAAALPALNPESIT